MIMSKTQSLYNWAVVEDIKVKDDNGQVESTKLKVHKKGTAMNAFDEANVKIKAMALTTLPEGTDVDEVRVEVRPF
jgi:hypothetical protein